MVEVKPALWYIGFCAKFLGTFAGFYWTCTNKYTIFNCFQASSLQLYAIAEIQEYHIEAW